MDISEELDFEVRLENLPGSTGIAARSKMPREHLIVMGEFFRRCADDPERKGMSLVFRADGQITLGTT